MLPTEHCTILIYESSLSGHRGLYAAILIEGALARGATVVVVLSEGDLDTVEFREYLLQFQDRVTFDFAIPRHPSRGWQNGYVRWRSLVASIVRNKPSLALVPTADILAQCGPFFWLMMWHPAFRKVEIDVVLHRLRFGYNWDGLNEAFRRVITWFALKVSPYRRILSVDDIPTEAFGNRGMLSIKNMSHLPDPISDIKVVGSDAARARFGLPTEMLIVGCSGALDDRKGIPALVHAFAAIAMQVNAVLWLAGRQSDTVRQALEQCFRDGLDRNRVRALDRFLTAEEFIQSIEAMDLVCIPSPAHIGISSVLLRADQCHRSVVGPSRGWIGATIVRRSIGWTYSPQEPRSLESVLLQSLQALSAGLRPRGPFGELAASHSKRRFLDVALASFN